MFNVYANCLQVTSDCSKQRCIGNRYILSSVYEFADKTNLEDQTGRIAYNSFFEKVNTQTIVKILDVMPKFTYLRLRANCIQVDQTVNH